MSQWSEVSTRQRASSAEVELGRDFLQIRPSETARRASGVPNISPHRRPALWQSARIMTDNAFASHVPSTEAKGQIENLRIAFSNLKATIEQSTPASRERSIALTELEAACMWAVKAVSLADRA